MKISEILRESFVLLRKEPKIFIPRLITTALYSFVLLYTAQLTTEMAKSAGYYPGNPTPDPAALASLMGGVFILLVSVIFLLIVDLFSYAMYPVMVRDYHKEGKIDLRKSFNEAFSAWKTILALWLLIMLFSLGLGVILSVFEVLTLQSGNSIYYVASLLVILSLVILLLIALFFIMPVAVVEKRGLIDTFKQGFKMSMKNKGDVFFINVFFLVLTAVTLGIISLSQIYFSEGVAIIAGILFILTRVFEAVIYTYISVVNPYFYMKVAK